MKINFLTISRKNKVIILSVLGTLFLGLSGFLVWRVTQEDTIAPEDSEAGGGGGACCLPNIGCISGFTCKEVACNDDDNDLTYESPIPAPNSGCTNQNQNTKLNGFVCCGENLRCRNLGGTSSSQCVNVNGNWKCLLKSTHTCIADAPNEPPTEGDCRGPDWECEWPQVVMSGTNDPSKEDVCRCENCTGKITSDPWSCTGNPPTNCTPGSCPTGYESCGTSVSHESGSDCVKQSKISCVVHHPDCNNPSYIFRYCKPKTVGDKPCEDCSTDLRYAHAYWSIYENMDCRSDAQDPENNWWESVVELGGVEYKCDCACLDGNEGSTSFFNQNQRWTSSISYADCIESCQKSCWLGECTIFSDQSDNCPENLTCMTTTEGYRCVNKSCPDEKDCDCTSTKVGCNKVCDEDEDCVTGYECINYNNNGYRCLNPVCPQYSNCICRSDDKLGCWDTGCTLNGDDCEGNLTCYETSPNTYRCVNSYCPLTSNCDCCPNGQLNVGEECDPGTPPIAIGGSEDVGDARCISNYGAGSECTPYCMCTQPDIPCGDGDLDTGEECDYNSYIYGDNRCQQIKDNPDSRCTSYCQCTEPLIETTCPDGILDIAGGEQCEEGNPMFSMCSWETECNQDTCKCPEVPAPVCEDTNLDPGEECAIGDPEDALCGWDECNHITCQCPEPTCPDWNLGDNEECELGNPPGALCTWDNCNHKTCECLDIPEPCGDGDLDYGEECEEGNPDGVSCTWNECEQSVCKCPEPQQQTNPDWNIDKTVNGRCGLINGETFALGSYMIKIQNVGDGQGSLDEIIDQLDSKVQESYINSISEDGVYQNNTITWDLEGSDEIIDPGESVIFTYSILIPEESFGIYENTVTGYPTTGDSFNDFEDITLECDIPEEPEEPVPSGPAPQTGIFDSILAKISAGVVLILIGLYWTKITYTLNEIVSNSKIRNFERKVGKKK